MDALGDRSVTGEMVAGRYRLGDPLGSGGMAEVFDAMDERLERPVAIKLLRTELSGDPGLRRRFEIEARAAARLVHPNVVGVFDTGEVGGRPYIVMERLPGATLADRLREERMDEPGTRRLASEVLGALAAAHAAGILHRDVKPSNILWARDGSAKVAGRDAYELVLAPRDTASLVGQVRLAVDAEHHIPLRVEVYAANATQPAFRVAFEQIAFTAPDAEQFTFNPPPGAKVENETVPSEGTRPDAAKRQRHPETPAARVVP